MTNREQFFSEIVANLQASPLLQGVPINLSTMRSVMPPLAYKVSGLNWPETLGSFTLMGPANRLGSWRWYQRRIKIDGAQVTERMKVEGLGLQPIWESLHTIQDA